LGVIGALSLSGFLILLLSCTHLLIVDFLRVVSVNEYRLVKPNHLNICVVCDCLSLLSLGLSLQTNTQNTRKLTKIERKEDKLKLQGFNIKDKISSFHFLLL
jgi:hypothetical protein